jgi:hypothetical protein
MQLQVTIEDIEYCIKNPVQIGVQYSNPIERAIRRDLCVPKDVIVEAYSNQAIIHFKSGQITVSYRYRNGELILFYSYYVSTGELKENTNRITPFLSFDLCPDINVIYHNLITKQQLKAVL